MKKTDVLTVDLKHSIVDDIITLHDSLAVSKVIIFSNIHKRHVDMNNLSSVLLQIVKLKMKHN